MSIQNLRSVVATASTASLLNPVSVRGQNTYMIGTNLLSWDEVNNYTLEMIAANFGQTVRSGSGVSQVTFKCGDSGISAYDFGLLFSCFTAIVAAYTEQGTTVFTEQDDTSTPGLKLVWFGNNAVLYCIEKNIIIPIKSADVQSACKNVKVKLENFVDTRTFEMKREKLSFVVDTDKGENLCRVVIPSRVQRALPHLFDDDPTNDDIVDDPNTPWDERSQLGSLIASSASMTNAEDTIRKYQGKVSIESVVVRSDLIITPTRRYQTTQEFLGSLCYSDKDVISLAVNFRGNLFVHRPWYAADNGGAIQVDSSPKLENFYNVTEECKLIERYAQSVTNVPLTAAQLDIGMFERIKTAFYDVELPRVKLESAFGRVVIPESVLVKGLSSAVGEGVFCLVLVGVIGKNVICRTAEGTLVSASHVPWQNDMFYDITEVIK